MVPLIPRTVLFGNPTRLSPSLSGCGQYLAYIAPDDGVQNLWAGPVDVGEFVPVTHDRYRGVFMYAWAQDDKHLLYLQDRHGEENVHLHAVPLSGGEPRDLTPFEGVQARLLGVERRVPGHVAVSLNLRDRTLPDAYRLELDTGRLELAGENGPDRRFRRWLFDSALRARGAVRDTPDGGAELLVRDDENAEWRTLHAVSADDAPGLRPVAFNVDGTHVSVLSSYGADTARLLRIRVSDGTWHMLYEDDRHDVTGVDCDPVTREPDMVLVQREHNDLEALRPGLADDLAALAEGHRGDVRVVDRDGSDSTWLVQYIVDDDPSTWHLYSRRTRTSRRLFSHQPALERYPLARTEPFSFAARDGLTIHGYLTFPPGQAREGLPAVLAVHGGPWHRDGWGYRGESQWLANRGYLCVQVNYRGSTGYGKRFVAAGDREWGGRMQDDLVDAVAWLTRAGHADPGRIAIMGGSYGGYAALAAVASVPEMFRCAIAVNAPADLRSFLRSGRFAGGLMRATMRRRVGDPDRDGGLLWDRSPLAHAHRVRAPVLIAQGATDPRVPRREAERMVAALREAGVPCEYLLFPDEGHGFVRPANRLAYYAAAERFLARHLGGRYEPPDAAGQDGGGQDGGGQEEDRA